MADTLSAVSPRSDFGDVKPLAHTDGPSTSHEAVARHSESGRRATHCGQVFGIVSTWPGRTSRELESHAQVLYAIDLTELRRRLTDLKNQGRIVQGDQRRCRVAGTLAVVWEVV